MADELEAPIWGDAVSASPGKFRQTEEAVEEELSATLANTTINHNPFDDAEREEEEEEEEEEDQDQSDEAAKKQEDDNEEVQQPLQKAPNTPKKDTSNLLSSLTEHADKGFITEVVSPKKDEALFSGINIIDTDTNPEDADPAKNNGSAAAASPTKHRRQNVYRAPRLRRVPLKHQADQTLDHSTATDTEDPQKKSDLDPLGPLGAPSKDDILAANESLSSGDDLLKLAEAPLFNINRTPLSPLKNPNDKTTASAPGSTISTTTSTSTSKLPDQHQEIEAAKLRLKAKQNPVIKMEINVGDPTKVDDFTSSHTVYSVRTNSDSTLFKDKQVVVSRRYTDFRWLYRQLQSTHPGRIIPPPPDKQVRGRFDQDFIEGRRFALERMLAKISESPSLQQDQDFIMFLQSERFTSEAREREKAASINSIFSEHETDKLNNGTGGSGLFGSLGGAFSFTPKIVEPDEYFKDKKSYIDSLDTQFRVFFKNLEAIVIQRQDLASVTEEFANIVLTLAELEISKSTTDIFKEFSTTQFRIKELLDRLSLQDMLTLGATLDEYQRVISSVKTTFDQRDKLLIHLANCETDLKKKQASLDKYVKYNRTQTDKIEILKTEVNTLEQKYKSAREKFDKVSDVIKEELANFEVEKIHDFRNSIEIYLESSIESQKEAVELWETFYNVSLSTT